MPSQIEIFKWSKTQNFTSNWKHLFYHMKCVLSSVWETNAIGVMWIYMVTHTKRRSEGFLSNNWFFNNDKAHAHIKANIKNERPSCSTRILVQCSSVYCHLSRWVTNCTPPPEPASKAGFPSSPGNRETFRERLQLQKRRQQLLRTHPVLLRAQDSAAPAEWHPLQHQCHGCHRRHPECTDHGQQEVRHTHAPWKTTMCQYLWHALHVNIFTKIHLLPVSPSNTHTPRPQHRFPSLTSSQLWATPATRQPHRLTPPPPPAASEGNSREVRFNLLDSLLRTGRWLPAQEIKEIYTATYWPSDPHWWDAAEDYFLTVKSGKVRREPSCRINEVSVMNERKRQRSHQQNQLRPARWPRDFHAGRHLSPPGRFGLRNPFDSIGITDHQAACSQQRTGAPRRPIQSFRFKSRDWATPTDI